MIKKIIILSLTFLFFAATTGLPLTFHYCKMMESAALEECPMHLKEINKISCCDKGNDYDLYFITSSYACCEIKIVDQSIKDTFLSPKTDFNLKTDISAVITNDLDFDHIIDIKLPCSTGTSPPRLTNNHIYLTNSILLI